MRHRTLALLGAAVGLCAFVPQQEDEQGYTMRPPGTLTYLADVRPIIAEHCLPCHARGGSAPFGLETYSQVRRQAQQIASDTSFGYMPPWTGRSDTGFQHQQPLTGSEILLLRQWINEGAKRGEGEETASLARPEWTLGKPDQILRGSAAALPAYQEARHVDIDLGFKSGKEMLLRAFDISPANRVAARQAVLFWTRGAESGRVGTWAIGHPPSLEKTDIYRIPAGARLALRVRFHPTGAVIDTGVKVGLYFGKSSGRPIRWTRVSEEGKTIPAGSRSFQIELTKRIESDTLLREVAPLAGGLCRKVTVLTKLDGKQVKLLDAKWNPAWNLRFRYREPLRLPAGSEVTAVFEYDNSKDNERNPNRPPKDVAIGAPGGETAILDLEFVKPGSPRA